MSGRLRWQLASFRPHRFEMVFHEFFFLSVKNVLFLSHSVRTDHDNDTLTTVVRTREKDPWAFRICAKQISGNRRHTSKSVVNRILHLSCAQRTHTHTHPEYLSKILASFCLLGFSVLCFFFFKFHS